MKSIATLRVCPSNPIANTFTSGSVNTSPNMANTMHIAITILNTLFVKFNAFFSPKSLFTSKYIGISTVPSVVPIIVNSTNGMFIAVRYASLYIDAPYDEASTNSRPKPNTFAIIVANIRLIVAVATLLIFSPYVYKKILYTNFSIQFIKTLSNVFIMNSFFFIYTYILYLYM